MNGRFFVPINCHYVCDDLSDMIKGHREPKLYDWLNELPSDRPVIFHCGSGKRSESILNFLILNDLYKENYLNLEGGYQAISI